MSTFNDRYKLYWGDLHNHNAVGYAKGSLARSIEIAREHLDFFAFTGHAHWHDMPQMPKNQHMHWVNGFKAHSEHWPTTRRMLREANDAGFAAFLGYEWHSSMYGDHCLIFPGDLENLFLPDDVRPLLDFAEAEGALAIPHHVAYKQGWRGANWANFRPVVSPVVEIFSEQGCTMSDRAPYPMLLHSNGGRVTSQTIEYQLDHGLRFGFVASTDDHFGYPGAYGEGIAGVWAESLDRSDIIEAIRARRTVAVTGDRIHLEVDLNGHAMGSEIPWTSDREIRVTVDAPDSIESLELVRNGRAIRRHFPQDEIRRRPPLPDGGSGTRPVRCRLQYGWGPWSALDLERVCEWKMRIRVEKGRLLGFDKCFQSGPFGEEITDSARQVSDSEIELHSFTSRRQAYLQDPTKALILHLDAAADTRLHLTLSKPVEMEHAAALGDLARENEVFFTGVFTSESVQLHRPVFPEESQCSLAWQDSASEGTGPDRYHVRVRQHNGQIAWSSPIWVG